MTISTCHPGQAERSEARAGTQENGFWLSKCVLMSSVRSPGSRLASCAALLTQRGSLASGMTVIGAGEGL
jgi:hypothetical protein